jgi:hypothetical protein
MALPALAPVQAVHDIPYAGRTAVASGVPGRVVNIQTGWAATTYTVEFRPAHGSTLTLVGLSDRDIRPL